MKRRKIMTSVDCPYELILPLNDIENNIEQINIENNAEDTKMDDEAFDNIKQSKYILYGAIVKPQ
eukprot:CAMPEP_0114693190 /NCGR_PEP_ID=MMETSP0191-20121206/68775_1 /TAXON_ID=126664 /ORGANISM="Sorites sp." /LENGTH=64 /DNA_ID=CAMNT_0001986515 /DNA_START=485 /DNA_END=679 /DNA_ORIENTATION=-